MYSDFLVSLCVTIDDIMMLTNQCHIFDSQSNVEWFIISFISCYLLDVTTNGTYIEAKQWFVKALGTSNASEAGILMKHPADSSILLHIVSALWARSLVFTLVHTLELKARSFNHFSHTSLITVSFTTSLPSSIIAIVYFIQFNSYDDICFICWKWTLDTSWLLLILFAMTFKII